MFYEMTKPSSKYADSWHAKKNSSLTGETLNLTCAIRNILEFESSACQYECGTDLDCFLDLLVLVGNDHIVLIEEEIGHPFPHGKRLATWGTFSSFRRQLI